jgi:hypothetical protein
MALERVVGLSRRCQIRFSQHGTRPTHIAMSTEMYYNIFGRIPKHVFGMKVIRNESLQGQIAVFNYRKEKT